MTDDKELERYAQLYFVDRVEAIAVEHTRRMAAITQDYASRGVASTALLNALQRELVERAVSTARAHIASIEEVHHACRKPIDDEALRKMEAGAINTILDSRRAILEHVLQRADGVQLGAVWRSRGATAVDREVEFESAKIRREFGMKRIALQAGNKLPMGKRWDVFISHASVDKHEVVLPLTDALTKKGIKVWLDSGELKLGDSLRQKIDEGLSHSRYGVVVFSPSFFERQWPQYELDALFTREVRGEKIILPVLHAMSHEDLIARSPLSSSKLCITWQKGIDAVVIAISSVVQTSQ